MPSTLIQALRSRWFAWGVHVWLWAMLYLVLTNAGGHTPAFHDGPTGIFPAQNLAPMARLDGLFVTARWPKPYSGTNSPNPFFTRYFVPVPAPAPTTRKIEVTYQGFYETGDGPKNVVVKVGEAFVIARIGETVATNLFVAQASMQSLTLTNPAAQTNLLPLNAKKEIEVPVK
jgi:hypothetical protein